MRKNEQMGAELPAHERSDHVVGKNLLITGGQPRCAPSRDRPEPGPHRRGETVVVK
jgi:hypothetical protein